MKRGIYGLLIACTIIIVLCASTLGIYFTDRAFICENTGSKKGYREWFVGAQTNPWYRKSELERFMELAHPNLLKHRWTSFAGDGKSLISFSNSRGHGRPGPILSLDPRLLDEHVSSLADTQKLKLYRTFSTGNTDTIRQKIDSISEAGMRDGEPK